MNGIKIRGIRLLNDCAFLAGSGHTDLAFLENVCSKLAARQLNLMLLAHIGEDPMGTCRTSLCTEAARGATAYLCVNSEDGFHDSLRFELEAGIVSIFPHENRPDVIGRLIQVLADRKVIPCTIASSPSALSVLVASNDIENLTDSLFGPFAFPAFETPSAWHAAYAGKEQVLKEIICSYQEEVIKVYSVSSVSDLGLFNFSVGVEQLGAFARALEQMQSTGLKIPFLVGVLTRKESIRFAACFSGTDRNNVGGLLAGLSITIAPQRAEKQACFTMHGPHFGDRFGIVVAMVRSLRKAGISPLAISCAVSSMSVIVDASDLNDSLEAVHGDFDVRD